MNKKNVINTQIHTHTHTECYSAIRKNEILPFLTYVDLEALYKVKKVR